MTSLLLSVIVPVLNEAENVGPLLDEITTALKDRWPYEVIFVDDASTDTTLAILTERMARTPTLRVLAHTARCGQTYAVRTGARAARGTWLVTLDGDGQNDPADVPALVEKALAGGEKLGLVGGLRLKRQDSLAKKIGSKVGNGVRQFFLRDGCPDTGCGLKVYRREVFLDLPVFHGLHRFLPALFQSRGYETAFVPVHHRHRQRGVSKYNNLQRALVGIVDLLGVAWLRARARRPEVREVHQ